MTEYKEALDNHTPIWSYRTGQGYLPLRNYNNEPYKEGDLVYNRDKAPTNCHIDEDDWILNYEPRCRPWYNMAWQNPDKEILVTYPSVDFENLWITLSKVLKNPDGEPMGVVAIDVDTSFLSEVLAKQTADDYFLITTKKQLVLYQKRTLVNVDGQPALLKNSTEYLFANNETSGNYNEANDKIRK